MAKNNYNFIFFYLYYYYMLYNLKHLTKEEFNKLTKLLQKYKEHDKLDMLIELSRKEKN